jgi:glycosyltransferase involved in cell wall biosynthesis
MFVEAAHRLTGEGVGAKFVLIGDGHLRAELEARGRALELAGTLLFAGFRRDVLSLYEDLDVVALTSLNEGTPLTLIEGMAAGCALASTEVGGVADLMGARQAGLDGFTIWDHGITAPSGEAATFARGLRYLLERPALRQAMGERGRAFVHARLSKERLTQDIEALYRELAGRDGRD